MTKKNKRIQLTEKDMNKHNKEYKVSYIDLIIDEIDACASKGILSKQLALPDLRAFERAARSEEGYRGKLYWLKAVGNGAFELITQRKPEMPPLDFYARHAEATPTEWAIFRLERLANAIYKAIQKIQRELDHGDPGGATMGDIAT